MKKILVKAWNNSAHHVSGAGYGIRISSHDIKEFDTLWDNITIRIQDQPVFPARITNSFWNGKCHEIRSKKIGNWIISSGNRYWDNGNPPSFEFNQIEGNLFELKKLDQ